MDQQKASSPDFECIWSKEYLESFANDILTENEMDSALKTSFVRILQEAIKISSDYYQFQRRFVHLASLALLKDHILTFKRYKQQYELKATQRQDVIKQLENINSQIKNIELRENKKKAEIVQEIKENQRDWKQQEIDEYLSIMEGLTDFNIKQPSSDVATFLLQAIENLNSEIAVLKGTCQTYLKDLTNRDKAEVRTFAHPPIIVYIQHHAYYILFKRDQPMTNFARNGNNSAQLWTNYRVDLGRPQFLQETRELMDTVFSIGLERILEVKQLIKAEEFDVQRGQMISRFIHSLMVYTVDLIRIYDKMTLLKKYEQLLEENKNEQFTLEEFKHKLSKIIQLKQEAFNESKFQEYQTKLEGLKEYLNKVQAVKKLTNSLINITTKEKSSYQKVLPTLTEHSLVFSALIVYSSAFDTDYQQSLYEIITKLLKTEAFQPSNMLVYFVEETEYRVIGSLGFLNVICAQSNKPKILIDPYTYGKQWLKLQHKNLDLTVYGHNQINELLKQSQQNNSLILIEKVKANFDHHQFHNQPLTYLSTILENPAFDPEIFDNFTVVNFNLATNDVKQQLEQFDSHFKRRQGLHNLEEEQMKIIEIYGMTKNEEQTMVEKLGNHIEQNSEAFNIMKTL